MHALVVSSSKPEHIRIREFPDPTPNVDEVLVDVYAISLNRGELTRLRTAPDGWRPGWDFAGTVVAESTDLPEGTRVVGLLDGGAWAERIAAPKTWLAPIPEGVTYTQAAALPVAGLTALRALRVTPTILGRRVLITGAAGGVGRFAVQLAHLGGATVAALVRSRDRAAGLRELGADEIVTDVDDLHGRFDLILESVGGESLARLVTKVDPDGTIVMFGNSSDQPTTFDVRDVYLGGAVRLQSFMLFHGFPGDPPGRDLSYLVQLLADGRIDPQVGAELSWKDMAAALIRLRERSILGKLVLTVR